MPCPIRTPAELPHPNRRAVAAGLATVLLPIDARADETRKGMPPQELVAAPADLKLGPEHAEAARLWLLHGKPAGPVLTVRHGDELALRLVNRTPSPLSLHCHGVRAPSAMDGVGGLSGPAVPPGGEFVYRFTPPDPGTFLLRPLLPGGSSEAAGRGLAGVLVVKEKTPPAVDGDHVLLLRDWKLLPSGELAPFGSRDEGALAGRLGNRIDVAGSPAPHRLDAAPGSRLRLRLVNGCNARIMRIRFDGMKASVAAVDGQPTETFQPLRDTLPFPPGTRYDVMVETPNQKGATCAVTALIGPGVPLVEIAAKGDGVASKPVASLPLNPFLPPEIKLQNALRRTVVLAGGAMRGPSGEAVMPPPTGPLWTMNGSAGSSANGPLFRAQRGQPVVLGTENRTGFPQPLHLHGHVFRLLHALDDGWEPYWLDTFQVPEGKTLHIAFLADNPGKWALSSTILERFDSGLWAWFEVA